jgi:hypothetical protein
LIALFSANKKISKKQKQLKKVKTKNEVHKKILQKNKFTRIKTTGTPLRLRISAENKL